MAKFEEHISQAKHNDEIADLLLNPDCTSYAWVTIISFYAAIQYIEASFAKTDIKHLDEYYNNLTKNMSGKKPSRHDVMEDVINADPILSSFYSEYRDLRLGSEFFRYLRPGYKLFLNDKYARKCFESSLGKIKRDLENNNLI